MSDSRATYHFKLVLLGNAGVGKSCLVLRFVRDEFYEEQETTIGGAGTGRARPIPVAMWECVWPPAPHPPPRWVAPACALCTTTQLPF